MAGWCSMQDGQSIARGKTDACTGFCASICVDIASDPKRFADILKFAAGRRAGAVCCSHATHRSVAAGQILQHLFHRTVDYRAATNPRCERCCRRPASVRLHDIRQALRSLPRCTRQSDLLAERLRLPSAPQGPETDNAAEETGVAADDLAPEVTPQSREVQRNNTITGASRTDASGSRPM